MSYLYRNISDFSVLRALVLLSNNFFPFGFKKMRINPACHNIYNDVYIRGSTMYVCFENVFMIFM